MARECVICLTCIDHMHPNRKNCSVACKKAMLNFNRKRWNDENAESILEARRQRYRANPKKGRECNRRRYHADLEKSRERNRRWSAAHPELVNQWRRDNPEKVREYNRSWAKSNPEKTIERNRQSSRNRVAKLQLLKQLMAMTPEQIAQNLNREVLL